MPPRQGPEITDPPPSPRHGQHPGGATPAGSEVPFPDDRAEPRAHALRLHLAEIVLGDLDPDDALPEEDCARAVAAIAGSLAAHVDDHLRVVDAGRVMRDMIEGELTRVRVIADALARVEAELEKLRAEYAARHGALDAWAGRLESLRLAIDDREARDPAVRDARRERDEWREIAEALAHEVENKHV